MTLDQAPRSIPTRQRQIFAIMFAGAATVAALALSGADQSGDPHGIGVPVAAAQAANTGISRATTQGSGGGIEAVDEGVNDNGQTSGDIFTQNAQDQSTA